MLTILWNRNNLVGNKTCKDFVEKLVTGIGIASEIPRNLRLKFAETAPVSLYDAGLYLDTVTDEQLKTAKKDAEELGAKYVMISVGYCCDMGKDESPYLQKLLVIKEFMAKNGMELWITNRRPYIEGECVSGEKLLRLSLNADVKIAHDIGSSHAHLHAMENYYDWKSQTAALLLNDNLGAHAKLPIGHYWYNPLSKIDIMQQPGWGSAPFVQIFADVKKNMPDIPLYFNGLRHLNCSLETVWEETQALMDNRVYISPGGAVFGKNEQNRLIIKTLDM